MGMFSKQNESGEEELPQGSSKSNHCFRLTGVKQGSFGSSEGLKAWIDDFLVCEVFCS